jgi:hypothetical protein
MISTLAHFAKSEIVAAAAATGFEFACAKVIAAVQSIHSAAADVSRFSTLQFKALLKTNGISFAAVASATPARCIYEA